MRFEDAVGIGIVWLSEEHIFTFLLSSPFTARTIGKEKGETERIKTDLNLSLFLSIITSLIIGFLFKSPATFIAGFLFGLVMYYVYAKRGKLW